MDNPITKKDQSELDGVNYLIALANSKSKSKLAKSARTCLPTLIKMRHLLEHKVRLGDEFTDSLFQTPKKGGK